jgi:hypothetical protein
VLERQLSVSSWGWVNQNSGSGNAGSHWSDGICAGGWAHIGGGLDDAGDNARVGGNCGIWADLDE